MVGRGAAVLRATPGRSGGARGGRAEERTVVRAVVRAVVVAQTGVTRTPSFALVAHCSVHEGATVLVHGSCTRLYDTENLPLPSAACPLPASLPIAVSPRAPSPEPLAVRFAFRRSPFVSLCAPCAPAQPPGRSPLSLLPPAHTHTRTLFHRAVAAARPGARPTTAAAINTNEHSMQSLRVALLIFPHVKNYIYSYLFYSV